MARDDLKTPPQGREDADDQHGRSQDQARDILAQWRARTLPANRNPQARLEDAGRMAEIFKVLGDPTRLNVLQVLTGNGELCVSDLAQQVGMSQSSVSHHLRVLRQSHLVRARRRGREVFYSPGDPHVETLLRVCLDHLRES